MFATRIHYSKVSTLQEVQQLGTKVFITSGVKNLIEPPLNEVQKKIFQDNLCLRPAEESSGFKLVLQLENTAYVSRRSDAISETALSFSDDNKEPLLSIVDECFRCYYVAYICTEGECNGCPAKPKNDFLTVYVLLVPRPSLVSHKNPKL